MANTVEVPELAVRSEELCVTTASAEVDTTGALVMVEIQEEFNSEETGTEYELKMMGTTGFGRVSVSGFDTISRCPRALTTLECDVKVTVLVIVEVIVLQTVVVGSTLL